MSMIELFGKLKIVICEKNKVSLQFEEKIFKLLIFIYFLV